MSPGPGRSMGENDPAAKLQGKKDKTPPRFKVPKPARIEATSTRLFFAFCFERKSLDERKRKTVSVWAGIIELHSKQSAGRLDVPTEEHKEGGRSGV